MTVRPYRRLAAAASVAIVLLSGCQSDEAKVADLFGSAEAYVAQRDFPRALIQFRNILKIDPDHVETRIALGEMFLSQGYLREAAREYTLLAERAPDEIAHRFALGQIAVMQTDWSALRRHADIAAAIAPDSPETAILEQAIAFRAAMRDDDPRARAAVVAAIAPMRAARPDEPVLLRIALEAALEDGRDDDALAILDDTLSRDPYRAELQIMRVRLLAEDGAEDPVDARLMELVALYPDDAEIASMLVARHMARGRTGQAIEVLRSLTDGAPADDIGARTVLVRFILRAQGPKAALTELDRLAEAAGEGPGARLYAAMDRAIRFDAGERDGAIAGLRDILDRADAPGEARMIRVLLARMLDREGDRREARAEVEAVLSEDPGDVGALKLRAGWAIEEERAKDAIVDLRSALSHAPHETELLGLMAAAHNLDGNPGLALEQLARAAQVSGHAAAPAERYARALVGEGRDRLAMRVLQAAQDAAPAHLGVSRLLGELHLQNRDWAGALQAAAHIDRIPGEAASAAAASLRAAVTLNRAPDRDGLADLYDADRRDQPALTRAVSELVAIDEAPLALRHIEELRAEFPDAPAVEMLRADLLGLTDRPDEAAAAYEALRTDPDLAEAATLRLFGLKAAARDVEGAAAVLARGLEDHPDSLPLRLLDADRRAAEGDRDGAVATLRAVLADAPDHPMAANNLAALLSEDSDDPAVLEEAARIVAPLRGDPRPQVADTIGWIAFKRGDAQGALPLMRRAARGMPGDPQVQMRLGQVHAALGETGAARAAYAAAMELVGPDAALGRDIRARLDALPRDG